MNDLLKEIMSLAALFNGRYEYREMHVVIQKMEHGEDVFNNTTKLRNLVEKFSCVSTYEIQIRKSLLSSIDEFLNYNKNVQSSKTSDDAKLGKTEGDSNTPDEKNPDKNEHGSDKNSGSNTEPKGNDASVNSNEPEKDVSPGDADKEEEDFEFIPETTK